MQSPAEQKAIVQRMIDAGESEENIATVIQHFKTTTQQPPPPAANQTQMGVPSLQRDVLKGLVQSVAKPIQAGGEMLRSQFPSLNALPSVTIPIDMQTDTTGEKIGQFAGTTAQFIAPTSVLQKTKAAIQTGRGVLDAILGAGLEAGSAAGVQTVQQGGSTRGTGLTASFAGGTSLASPIIGKGLSWLGERVERSLIKATKADIENGFMVGNVFKHQLGGSISQTYDKAAVKLAELGTQLRAELAKTGPGGVVPEVDVLTVLGEAAQELANGAHKTIGRNASIQAAIGKFLDDVVGATKNGKADLVTANEIKQGVGELGAWAHGSREADANAMEIVANAFYSKLRAAIEKAAPAGPTRISALNRQMGEIIPIRQAIIRRIPVEQRQNVLNLGDIIGVSTGAWGLALANRFLRSGQAANMAAQAGQAASSGSSTLPQVVAGTTSQVRR